jgi:pyruvate/2-oxoglutarate dehydrogenase complex dihydrolipoamide acyltransferase (E2) component
LRGGGDEGVNAGRRDHDVAVIVPNIGDGYFPGLILTEWLVCDGQLVDSGVLLLTVSTDKVDVDLPSPARGILEITVKSDTIVQAGETVAVIHPTTPDDRQPP